MSTRTVRIPIAEVDGDRREFSRDLRDSLGKCRVAYNRCLTECAVIDREAHVSGKVGKCPKLYTYPHIANSFPGASSVASSIARSAEKKYKESRFKVVTGRMTLPMQRSCPLPLLHNKSTKAFSVDTSGECVWATIKLLSGATWRVKLRGGSNYARQISTIRECEYGDSMIWIDGSGRAVLGIACKVEPADNSNGSGTLHVSTARDAFIVATKQKSETPFAINADHVQRWMAEHARRRGRLMQDRKSGKARDAIGKQLAKLGRKHGNRIKSFMHETTSQIVAYARRRRVATVEYDGTIRSYFGSFPYFEFANLLKYKCEDAGIDFASVTSEVVAADLDSPHVYFVTPVVDGKVNGRVKIGMTTQAGGKRKKALEMSGGCDELLVLATASAPKTRLRQLEKHYHSLFAAHRIDGQQEWFRSEPVVEWLREVGCLGNAGNLSQITQYMEA